MNQAYKRKRPLSISDVNILRRVRYKARREAEQNALLLLRQRLQLQENLRRQQVSAMFCTVFTAVTDGNAGWEGTTFGSRIMKGTLSRQGSLKISEVASMSKKSMAASSDTTGKHAETGLDMLGRTSNDNLRRSSNDLLTIADVDEMVSLNVASLENYEYGQGEEDQPTKCLSGNTGSW